MKNNFIYTCNILLFLFFFVSCKNSNRQVTDEKNNTNSETLVEVNKFLIRKDSERIKAYIKRREWDMTETKTGLWYMVYEKGKGEKARKGQIAVFDYKVELLDGTLCYDSGDLGPKQFKIGEGGVESGLEEGILLLAEGDKAKFIMPPYLAHGLIGDEVCIPARSIIVYDVTLLKLLE
jgi:FKBP-type peptidyl-prolyl cis-trans isomerase FkpA